MLITKGKWEQDYRFYFREALKQPVANFGDVGYTDEMTAATLRENKGEKGCRQWHCWRHGGIWPMAMVPMIKTKKICGTVILRLKKGFMRKSCLTPQR